jgi:hypothetical protein
MELLRAFRAIGSGPGTVTSSLGWPVSCLLFCGRRVGGSPGVQVQGSSGATPAVASSRSRA